MAYKRIQSHKLRLCPHLLFESTVPAGKMPALRRKQALHSYLGILPAGTNVGLKKSAGTHHKAKAQQHRSTWAMRIPHKDLYIWA